MIRLFVQILTNAIPLTFLLVLMSAPLMAQEPPLVAESVTAVATGGYWEEGERAGVIRVLVVDEGQEHVSSRVYLEWMEESPRRVVLQVPIPQINEPGYWSVGGPVLQPSENGLLISLPATHTYSLDNLEFKITVHGPGDFELEEISP